MFDFEILRFRDCGIKMSQAEAIGTTEEENDDEIEIEEIFDPVME